jgi:membrane-associated protein
MDRVGHLADDILRIPPAVALLLVFALPALEASAFVGFLVPAEPGVVLGGVLANQHKVPLWAVLVAAIAGAVIGDSIGYEVGHRYGRRVLAHVPHRILKPQHLDRAESTVRRYGGRAVFLGRFTTTLRILVPGFAGMSRVPYREFLVWNAAGGVIWASFFVLVGYLAGSQWRTVTHNATLIGLGVVAVVVVVGVVHVWHRRRTARRATDVTEDRSDT